LLYVYTQRAQAKIISGTQAKIISGKPIPTYLSSDHDPLFNYYRWQANLRILEINEIKTIPYTPISHPFVERLIGTIRREYLDHMLFWNAKDLENKLQDFQQYYNERRAHSSIDRLTPVKKTGGHANNIININNYRWKTVARSLYQLPVAA